MRRSCLPLGSTATSGWWGSSSSPLPTCCCAAVSGEGRRSAAVRTLCSVQRHMWVIWRGGGQEDREGRETLLQRRISNLRSFSRDLPSSSSSSSSPPLCGSVSRKIIRINKRSNAYDEGGARTMEIGPIRNQNLIFWPLASVE